jgi:hypothetical protein
MKIDLSQYRNASNKYRPDAVKLLLVGEAPPPSQKHYIYWPKQMSRAQLENDYSFPATVFGHFFDRKPVDINEYDQFLYELKKMTIWILDMYEEPIKVGDRNLPNNRIEANFQKVKGSIKSFRHRLESLKLGHLKDEQIIFLPPRGGYNREIKSHFPNSKIVRWADFRLRRGGIQLTKIEDHPDFKEYDKCQLWIYKLEHDYVYQSELEGYHFQSEWLAILPDGVIKIKKGYAWNGCSPKFSIFDLFILGTSDGIIDIQTMKPKAYYASLVHDALYQYYEWHDIPRDKIDKQFYKMLEKSKFKLARLYYLFVRDFGGCCVGEKHKYSIPTEFN